MLLSMACALAASPLTLGGGAAKNLTLTGGFGADLNHPSRGVPVRRSTTQTLQARLDAVLVPALALTVEATGGRNNTDLGWLITSRVRSAGDPSTPRVDFMSRSLAGELFVGLGSQLGNEELELQLGIGPTVGASGLAPGSHRKVVEDHELQPDPTPFEVGGRSRFRMRGQVAPRVAFEGGGGIAVVRTLNPARYLNPSRGQEEVEPVPDATSLRLVGGLEGQVQLVSELWATLGVHLENERRTQAVEGGRTSSWSHDALVQLGVRWR